MPKFNAALDMAKNEIRRARMHNLPSAPPDPVPGQEYFDTTTNVLYYWNGTVWVEEDGRTAVPEGPAGGDLTGNYPNPTIGAGVVNTIKLADSAVTGPKVDSSIKDAGVGVPSLRTLGTGANQAAAGNDPRLTDKRTPLPGSVTDAEVAPNAAIKLSKLETDPLARANHTGTQPAATISDFDQQVRTSRLDQMAYPTNTVSLNGQRLAQVADPVNAQDAATKAYVDASVQGLDVKQSVRAATTANMTLSGLGPVDGVTLVAGNSVLVKNQTNPAENGIYTVSSGAWTRRTDADSGSKLNPGAFTFVEEGAVNADNGYVLTTDGAVTLGTTALNFVQFSGAGQIDAGNGLTRQGNRLDVGGTPDRITVGNDNVDIASTYAGQASITTLGTVTTGTWQATTIAVAKGGTGATTAAAARANLGVPVIGTFPLTGGATSEVVTHNFGTRSLQVTVYQTVTPYAEEVFDIEHTTTNSITIRAGDNIAANSYEAVITARSV